jgi:hypothetical protein
VKRADVFVVGDSLRQTVHGELDPDASAPRSRSSVWKPASAVPFRTSTIAM